MQSEKQSRISAKTYSVGSFRKIVHDTLIGLLGREPLVCDFDELFESVWSPNQRSGEDRPPLGVDFEYELRHNAKITTSTS